VHCWPET